jgi:site-specific DNA-methyltransferase (cytosine-N4-specific)
MDEATVQILQGDTRLALPRIEMGSHRSCVTSPPYWRQRRYGADPAEIGQEATPEAWVAALVKVFGMVRPLLTDDGSLWLNVGDKYAASGMGGGQHARNKKSWLGTMGEVHWRKPPEGFKPKDLTLSPFLLADALRRDGWYLRQTIIWEKPLAVEPQRLDRPSVSHEYVFLFSVSGASAVRDPGEPWFHTSVWRLANQAATDHVAKMPVELARRCIVAGTREGDWVLDPFGGSGTTAVAATRNGRNATIVELYPENVDLAHDKVSGDAPMFASDITVSSPEQLSMLEPAS